MLESGWILQLKDECFSKNRVCEECSAELCLVGEVEVVPVRVQLEVVRRELLLEVHRLVAREVARRWVQIEPPVCGHVDEPLREADRGVTADWSAEARSAICSYSTFTGSLRSLTIDPSYSLHFCHLSSVRCEVNM